MRLRLSRLALLGAGIGALGLVLFFLWPRPKDTRYVTSTIERGEVTDVVGATGTLEAVTTVQVGSQVSGTILTLDADFNSVVKQRQVIARLDPSLFEARLGQSRANLVSARANAERARAAVADTEQKLKRAEELATQNLLPVTDLETARANQAAAVAQVKAADAAVTQAEASVNQADVDLAHTVIEAPIDGIVIARNVSMGQTVAASFQAPVLFVIANDLTRMRVNASIDEADIGRVREGQEVTFRVDAYPERTFGGRVEQVRLQPTTVQNVVTYNTIVAVENPEQQLMPGMTATVSVIVRRADDVLRLPAAALRFRPEGFEKTASGAPGRAAGPGGRTGPNAREAGTAMAAPGPRGEARSGEVPLVRMDGGAAQGRGRRSGEAPPATRFLKVDDGGQAGGHRSENDSRPALVFVPGPGGVPEAKRIRVGISDGQFVELREGLEEGAQVITGLEGQANRGPGRPGGSPSSNPFNPQVQRRQR